MSASCPAVAPARSRPGFATASRLTCGLWRVRPEPCTDFHDEIELNLLESGSVTYLHGGTKTKLQPGRLTAFWAAIPSQLIDVASATACHVARIPLQRFLQWRLPEQFVQALLQGRMVTVGTGGDRNADRQCFTRWATDLRSPTAETEQVVLLEMHARLLRLAGQPPDATRPPVRREAPPPQPAPECNRAERMACLIARRYQERITVRDIAESVDLHPNYAMNLFHRTFGTTLLHCLIQHRVSHAQRLLATSDLTVAAIAADAGFGSISRFNDAFRRACGCAPREYRRSHRAD